MIVYCQSHEKNAIAGYNQCTEVRQCYDDASIKYLMILIRIHWPRDEFPGPFSLTGNSCTGRSSDVMHGASVLRLLDIELIHVQLYMYFTQKKYRLILCQLHQYIPFKTYATFNIERFVAAVMYILQ